MTLTRDDERMEVLTTHLRALSDAMDALEERAAKAGQQVQDELTPYRMRLTEALAAAREHFDEIEAAGGLTSARNRLELERSRTNMRRAVEDARLYVMARTTGARRTPRVPVPQGPLPRLS